MYICSLNLSTYIVIGHTVGTSYDTPYHIPYTGKISTVKPSPFVRKIKCMVNGVAKGFLLLSMFYIRFDYHTSIRKISL